MNRAAIRTTAWQILLYCLLAHSPGLLAEEKGGHRDQIGDALAQEQAFLYGDPYDDTSEQPDNFIPSLQPAQDLPGGDEDADSISGDPVSTTLAREQAFLNAITRIESSHGAYASELPEHMLSLGMALQRQQRHEEAVATFKRGVHLARINNGLYSAEQIPLLQGEINSHVALGEYDQADERQHYLYRVQVRSLGSGQERASALLGQADYQYRAYRLGLGWQGFGRLTNMWDLYRLALNDIINQDGESSAKLLAPLKGMLRTQYLISGFEGESEEPGLSFSADANSQQQANRFFSYRSQSYKLGKSVIQAIYQLHQQHYGPDSVEAANALVMLGDWALWNGKRDEASTTYAQAIAELAALDDAQLQTGHPFAEPVPLPAVEGLEPLPPAVAAEQGDILLEFGVDPRGRVIDLVRIDEDGDHSANSNRLMRELRKTRFRPRFEEGHAVGTEKLVRAYDIER